MMVPAWLLGGLVGLVLAIVTYTLLGKILANMHSRGGRIEQGSPGHTLDLIRKLDFVTMPVICAVISHFAFGGSQ